MPRSRCGRAGAARGRHVRRARSAAAARRSARSDGRAALDAAARAGAAHRGAPPRSTSTPGRAAFFLLALALCIAVIARALRAEARVLEEQDNFLALVSHQFKTPLASLQLSLETLALRTLGARAGAHPHRPHAGRPRAHGAHGHADSRKRAPGARPGRFQGRAAGAGRGGGARRGAARGARAPGAATISYGRFAADLYVLSDPLAVDVVVRNLLENARRRGAARGGGRVELHRARRRRRGRAVGEGQRRRLPARRRRAPVREVHAPAPRRRPPLRHRARSLHRAAADAAGAWPRARHSDGVGQGAHFVLTWPAAAREPRA